MFSILSIIVFQLSGCKVIVKNLKLDASISNCLSLENFSFGQAF